MLTYEMILEKIKNKEPFSFSRWWDGERDFMFKLTNKPNCDGNTHLPAMWDELKQIIDSRPDYYLGMQWLAMTLHWWALIPYINNMNWVNADIIHFRSIDSWLNDIIELLNESDTIMVWAEYLKDIWCYKEFVQTPNLDSHNEIDRIMEDIENKLWDFNVVVFAVGATTNCLIDRLYKKYWNKHILLDIGSALDPYVWRRNRVYQHDLVIK